MDESGKSEPEKSTVDLTAANELVTKNIRLAYSFARKHGRRGLDPDEVESLAMEGLIKASRSYDPSKGAFSTWAVWKMRGAVDAAFRGRNAEKRSAARTKAFLQNEDGQVLDPADYRSEEAATQEVQEAIQKIWAKLDARERTVLRGRFWDGKTLEEIAKEFGITKERVRQIETAALAKARRRILNRRDAGKSSVELECDGCKRKFTKREAEVRYHQKKGANRFYCSKKCFYKNRWSQIAWSDRDDATLLSNRHLPYKELAHLIGRSVTAIRSRLARLNATKQKWWWSAADIQFLRDHVGTMTMRELGEKLGRTAGAIGIRLYAMGLTHDHTLMNPMRDARARELHAAGRFDKDIASEIGVHPSVIWHWRKRNGIKVNGHAGYCKSAKCA